MRVFTSLCVDNKFGYPMVASECSYNEACFFIECNLNQKISHCSKEIMTGITVIKTVNGVAFIYDENRGYLMKKE